MTLTQPLPASEGRFEALKAKHSSLEHEIHDHQLHHSPDETLKSLKRAKLKVKEEMEALR